MTNFVLNSCLVTDELLIDCLSCCRYQAKFLTYCCLSIIFVLSKEIKLGVYVFDVCCVN